MTKVLRLAALFAALGVLQVAHDIVEKSWGKR